MSDLPHEPSGLSTATWTDADFDSMGWHDCRIHALSISEIDETRDGTLVPARLLLDLDYIVSWVPPARRQRHLTFWVSPATLVFDHAWNITGRLDVVQEALEIADIHRLDPPDDQAEPCWHIEGQNFDLRLRAAGFRQYLRRPPVHGSAQVLGMTERGGLSFAEQPFG